MECPVCGNLMKFSVDRTNGKGYWHCPVCDYSEPTADLAPASYNNVEDYKIEIEQQEITYD